MEFLLLFTRGRGWEDGGGTENGAMPGENTKFLKPSFKMVSPREIVTLEPSLESQFFKSGLEENYPAFFTKFSKVSSKVFKISSNFHEISLKWKKFFFGNF